MNLDRRQLLKALGFGAIAGTFGPGRVVHADEPKFPTRIVFYVQPHGHVPKAWTMAMPGAPTDRFAERALGPLAAAELSPTLRPLHPFRDRLLAIEGLSHTSVLANIADVVKNGGDLNNHQVGVAGVLTGTMALQRPGEYCTGGSASIDQVLAKRAPPSLRFASRVYGANYIPNSIISPFSYLGPGLATPIVTDPHLAFADLIGAVAVGAGREGRLAALRPSVLDAVSREYQTVAPTLGREGREKLDRHRAFVRGLEKSLATSLTGPACSAAFDAENHPVRQFMSMIRLAFACDLTRIVTFAAPVPETTELGYPADTTFHNYAHASIKGATSCGSLFTPTAEQAMIDLDRWHAEHFAFLLQELDAVPEGSGTLLDHTVVVWVTELATPTHEHHDVATVLAGGAHGFFKTGRYVRYPRNLVGIVDGPSWPALTGPAHNRLLVTLMQALGEHDDTFGLADAQAWDGTTQSFRGPLAELSSLS